MAGSLAALKNLACPAGNKCTAFQCLFKHDSDVTVATASKNGEQSLIPEAPTAPLDQLSSDQEQPRKRIKLDSQKTSAPPHPQPTKQVGPQESTSNQQARVKMPPAQTSIPRDGLDDNKKPKSPPTINRQPQTLAEQPAQRSGVSSAFSQKPRDLSTSPSTTPVGGTAKLVAKAAPKKPEALNPRLLKSSPAQHDTRMKLVKALHEQYVRLNTELKKDATDEASKKLVLSDQELIVKTLDDEQEIAIKRFKIYGNAIRNKILACKRMSVAQWKKERMEATKGTNAQDTETAASPSEPVITGLTVPQEVEFLHRLIWPLEGLEQYGYVSSVPSDEDIQKAREGVEASGNNEVCDRCTRRFQVFPGRREEDGALASNGTCTYHPGKTYTTDRKPGDLSKPTRKYRCCHKNVNDESGGCTTASTHVFKTTDPNRLATILNFAETPPNPDVPADRAVAFDCEMGYTVYGLELIRLTAVSWPNGEELLDILVQPYGEYMDLNTRYSGVRPEDMVTAERLKPGDDHRPTMIPSSDPAKPPERKLKLASSPKAARDLLFSLIAPETPLIGHGLENDLNAARVIHPTCIDTVLLYPHKRGLPIRNGLKMLMETLLNKKIQVEAEDGKVEGHDSAEDARAAGELVRLKVRDQWKEMLMKGWVIQDDKMVPPAEGWTLVGGAKTKKHAT
ncbi:RNA exonuclease 3 [Parahypoxylon ruwenzoriense]